MSERVVGVIGISSGESARYACFYDELTQVDRPDNVVVLHAVGLYVNQNRNQIAEQAIAMGAEWILYVDDDHIFQPDTLQRLLAHNVDIVSALCVRRVAPFLPVIYDRVDADGEEVKHYFTPEDVGLKPVLAAGAGCLLVRTYVHTALGPPYWRFSQTVKGNMVGEDIDFCQRAREKGYKVWCDTDTPIGHRLTVAAFPYQVSPGKWMLNILDSKGTLIVNGPTRTGPV